MKTLTCRLTANYSVSRLFATMVLIVLHTASNALALDFFGAKVIDKDAPASYMNKGILGYRPTVVEVEEGSPAKQYGLTRGDIILSVDQAEVRSVSDFKYPLPISVSIVIFNKTLRKTITIVQTAPQSQAVVKSPSSFGYRDIEPFAKSKSKVSPQKKGSSMKEEPALVFDKDYLDRRFGKKTSSAGASPSISRSGSEPEAAPPQRVLTRPRLNVSPYCERGHWIQSKTVDGGIIVLEDASVWEVNPIDRIDSMLWLPISNIISCEDKLINTDDGETVSVIRLR